MLTSDKPLPLYADRALLRMGIQRFIPWRYAGGQNNVLVVGPSGSGKTVAALLLAARLASRVPHARAYVCDFKNADWAFLEGRNHYYSYLDCVRGLDEFHEAFTARQMGVDPSREPLFLIFDEWQAFCSTLPKPQLAEAQKKLAAVMMLGRSFGVGHINIAQDAYAQNYGNARSNFQVAILMGNISKEAAGMFGLDRKDLSPVYGPGAGHMLVNGVDLHQIQVPTIREMSPLQAAICQIVE